MRRKKTLLLIISSVIAILIIAIILVLVLRKKPKEVDVEEKIDVETLESEFSQLFNNEENEFIKTLYNIVEEKSGEYKIQANIPYIVTQKQIDSKINKEINDLFVNLLLQTIRENENYTILNIDYSTDISDNILSLAVKCILKKGSNAQRTVIKTYNYDIENQKELEIVELISTEKQQTIQNQIKQKIEKEINKEETIAKQYPNIYRRNKESDIYILENATEFYIKDNVLYIIYCYGNNSYTSEIDLIINKI